MFFFDKFLLKHYIFFIKFFYYKYIYYKREKFNQLIISFIIFIFFSLMNIILKIFIFKQI